MPLNVELLEKVKLAHGAHADRSNGLCAMELVAWMADEPHSDHPSCVCPVLGAFVRRLNDRMNDTDRQDLKPYLPKLIGTATDGASKTRMYLALDWLTRTCLPAWLDLAGLKEEATELRGLATINSSETRSVARLSIAKARDRASKKCASAYAASSASAAASAAAYAASYAAYAYAASSASAAASASAYAASSASAAASAAASASASASSAASSEKQQIKTTQKEMHKSSLQLLGRMIDAKAA